MDDKKKKLRKMATWTVTIFAAVFAVIMAVMWILLYRTGGGTPVQVLGQALGMIWYIILIAAVLCVGVYFGYSLYLKKQK
jgi:type VI protein secretion system component VasF